MARGRARNPLDDTTATLPPILGTEPDGERGHPTVLVLAGASVGAMYRLNGTRMVMGRGDKVDIRLFDEGISREHAQLVQEGDRVFLEDMGSTNGTFCNGARVTRQELAGGDKILIGSTTI